MEAKVIMRALDMEVVDAVWEACRHRIPEVVDNHPKGGHRQRIDDRLCFRGILIRLVTGCSWVDVESILDGTVSDTTLRERRDEWIEAGVFDALVEEALLAYDRIIEFDFSEACIDGSLHKAPCGGEGAGKNPTDRAKLGHKWSIGADSQGIPFAWSLGGANRNDSRMLTPTLADALKRGLLIEIETLHLDRGYDSKVVRMICAGMGIDDAVIAKRKKRGAKRAKQPLHLGLRWTVERTNSWLSNFGQLRRNTDRRSHHRRAQFALAIVLLITAKLIDWRNRWSPVV
jgi:transposase